MNGGALGECYIIMENKSTESTRVTEGCKSGRGVGKGAYELENWRGKSTRKEREQDIKVKRVKGESICVGEGN